jgi:hypothetical protein
MVWWRLVIFPRCFASWDSCLTKQWSLVTRLVWISTSILIAPWNSCVMVEHPRLYPVFEKWYRVFDFIISIRCWTSGITREFLRKAIVIVIYFLNHQYDNSMISCWAQFNLILLRTVRLSIQIHNLTRRCSNVFNSYYWFDCAILMFHLLADSGFCSALQKHLDWKALHPSHF